MTSKRKASDIPKAELVFIIAKLRGVLYNIDGSWKELDCDDREEVKKVLKETAFDDDLNESYSHYSNPTKEEEAVIVEGRAKIKEFGLKIAKRAFGVDTLEEAYEKIDAGELYGTAAAVDISAVRRCLEEK